MGRAATRRAGMIAGAMVVGALASGARDAAAQSWGGRLTGSQEVPAVPTAASGFVTLTLTGNLLTVNLSWTGLSAPPAAGHIHCCAAFGINAPVVLPFTGLVGPTVGTSGTYVNTFDLSNPAVFNNFAGGEAALIAGLNANQAYVNIHDAVYPGGEIRADVTTIPEPTTVALAALGLGGAGLVARRRRHG